MNHRKSNRYITRWLIVGIIATLGWIKSGIKERDTARLGCAQGDSRGRVIILKASSKAARNTARTDGLCDDLWSSRCCPFFMQTRSRAGLRFGVHTARAIQ